VLQPRGHRPTNRPVCATGRQSAAKPVCLIPRGRILEVSTEVWLNPRELQASCVPRTGLRSLEPGRRSVQALPRFYVPGGRCTQVWHDPTLLSCAHCLLRGLPCSRCRLRCGRCSDRSLCVQLQSCWRSRDRWSQIGIVLRLTPKATD